jgi:hypothetical protein
MASVESSKPTTATMTAGQGGDDDDNKDERPAKAQVDDLLRRKRKAREHKACYPCRQRKVRCDLGRPCRTCVEREHAELCDYHPPVGKRHQQQHASLSAVNAASDSAATVTLARGDFEHLCRKLDRVESGLDELRRDMRAWNNHQQHQHQQQTSGRSSPSGSTQRTTVDNNAQQQQQPWINNQFTRHTTVHGLHARNDLTGQTVHLGGSSVPALVMALGQGDREQPSVQEILGRSILPMFGLDNETATYPFVDLWGLAHGSLARAQELAKTIPTDSQCLSFFRYYKDLGNIIFPGVADISTFEMDLTRFLQKRNEQMGIASENSLPGVNEQAIYDKNLEWIGLLFAVLASGCQCSGLARKERELTSQVYSMCVSVKQKQNFNRR